MDIRIAGSIVGRIIRNDDSTWTAYTAWGGELIPVDGAFHSKESAVAHVEYVATHG